jgi:hypothetical protein
VPATGTLVETYLRSRGIVMPIPATLRFHGGAKHARGKFWPAMVALVTRGTDGVPLAIHRIYIARDGASKAPIEPAKMMLGPCRGGRCGLVRSQIGCWSPRASKTRSRPCRRPDKRHGPHSRHPGCARSNCRWKLAMSLCLPMATSPARRQRTTRRGAGNEEAARLHRPPTARV